MEEEVRRREEERINKGQRPRMEEWETDSDVDKRKKS